MRAPDSIYSTTQVSESIAHEDVDPELPDEGKILPVSMNDHVYIDPESEIVPVKINPELLISHVEVDPVFIGISITHVQESIEPVFSTEGVQSSSMREILSTTLSYCVPL